MGSVGLGMVRSGLGWFGRAWDGSVRSGSARGGSFRFRLGRLRGVGHAISSSRRSWQLPIRLFFINFGVSIEFTDCFNASSYEQLYLLQSDEARLRKGTDRPARRADSGRQTPHDYLRRRQRPPQRRLRPGRACPRGAYLDRILGHRAQPFCRDAAQGRGSGQGAGRRLPAGRGRRFGDRRHEAHRRRAALRR